MVGGRETNKECLGSHWKRPFLLFTEYGVSLQQKGGSGIDLDQSPKTNR
ncbi:hypothetical protein Z945_1535 [Sulfitobacter noctilucae]|nr:hypothetical protein Z945_1535 [Sulfitobacter noctilucae]